MKRAKTSGFVVDLLLTVEMQPTKPEVFKRALRQKTAPAVFATRTRKRLQRLLDRAELDPVETEEVFLHPLLHADELRIGQRDDRFVVEVVVTAPARCGVRARTSRSGQHPRRRARSVRRRCRWR